MIETLQKLIKERDETAVSVFIDQYPSVLDQKDENGSSGFMLLAYGGMKGVFDKAIQLKEKFNFFEAIVAGKNQIVIERIRHNPQMVNKISADGFPALTLSCFFNKPVIAKLLLYNHADPNLHATNPSMVCALHSAVAIQNIQLCRMLIDYGGDVNEKQTQNVTALHSATHRGNLEMVKLLVEHGADVDSKMDNGDTAKSIAKREGHKSVLNYLNSI